jgi:hypothetical protein
MNTDDVARIASLVGEPSSEAMLPELMDGRALDVTAPGQRVLGGWLGSERWAGVAGAREPVGPATASRRA